MGSDLLAGDSLTGNFGDSSVGTRFSSFTQRRRKAVCKEDFGDLDIGNGAILYALELKKQCNES